MSWMGTMPRSTRALDISTTSCDSHSASALHSPLILSTLTWVKSSSADRSRPMVGCRVRSSSYSSITPRTSKSVSFRQRRIWHSSNV
jgi:hypothetical protein